jgi:hypothetical protein
MRAPSSVRPVLVLVSCVGLCVSCSGSSKNTADLPRAPAAADAGPDAGSDAGGDEHIPTLTGPPRLQDGRYFVDEGAPHPTTCREDKDCIGDTVPDDTGCCIRSSDPFPQTFAWHAWVTRRRLSETCDEVKCPPLPVPSMPEVCRLRARCDGGTCRDSCSEEPGEKEDQGQKEAPEEKQ